MQIKRKKVLLKAEKIYLASKMFVLKLSDSGIFFFFFLLSWIIIKIVLEIFANRLR